MGKYRILDSILWGLRVKEPHGMSPHDFYIFQINKKVIKSAIERYIVRVCDPKRDLIALNIPLP